ncbi:hypothetical protein [Streptomyces sp. NPDC002088]|uniref:hypothetical protein n=1 Tax=unclassified Streptomyces TaxID=2593676 RepID=UPI00332F87BA
MSMLRKLNSKLAETTGYQVRRLPAPTSPPTSPSGSLGAIPEPRGPRPAKPGPAPRHLVDPVTDRLLDRPVPDALRRICGAWGYL